MFKQLPKRRAAATAVGAIAILAGVGPKAAGKNLAEWLSLSGNVPIPNESAVTVLPILTGAILFIGAWVPSSVWRPILGKFRSRPVVAPLEPAAAVLPEVSTLPSLSNILEYDPFSRSIARTLGGPRRDIYVGIRVINSDLTAPVRVSVELTNMRVQLASGSWQVEPNFRPSWLEQRDIQVFATAEFECIFGINQNGDCHLVNWRTDDVTRGSSEFPWLSGRFPACEMDFRIVSDNFLPLVGTVRFTVNSANSYNATNPRSSATPNAV